MRTRRVFMFSHFYFHVLLFGIFMCTWEFSRANAVDIAQFDTCITSRDIFSYASALSINCLNRFPRRGKKRCSLDKEPKFMPAALFVCAVMCCFGSECCEWLWCFSPMILNNDGWRVWGETRKDEKMCTIFLLKNLLIAAEEFLWWESYVSDEVKQNSFLAYQLILFISLNFITYNIFFISIFMFFAIHFLVLIIFLPWSYKWFFNIFRVKFSP